jgi:hypothetical protein
MDFFKNFNNYKPKDFKGKTEKDILAMKPNKVPNDFFSKEYAEKNAKELADAGLMEEQLNAIQLLSDLNDKSIILKKCYTKNGRKSLVPGHSSRASHQGQAQQVQAQQVQAQQAQAHQVQVQSMPAQVQAQGEQAQAPQAQGEEYRQNGGRRRRTKRKSSKRRSSKRRSSKRRSKRSSKRSSKRTHRGGSLVMTPP